MSLVISQLINGLQSGSIYALIALGYSMVYGIIMLLNFAHGDIIMVGAYVDWLAMTRLALSPIIAIVLAILPIILQQTNFRLAQLPMEMFVLQKPNKKNIMGQNAKMVLLLMLVKKLVLVLMEQIKIVCAIAKNIL